MGGGAWLSRGDEQLFLTVFPPHGVIIRRACVSDRCDCQNWDVYPQFSSSMLSIKLLEIEF